MWYVRANDFGSRGYKYVGGFETQWQAVAHKILMFPDEPCDKYSKIEQYSAEDIRYCESDGINLFVRPDSRQIAKVWKERGLTESRQWAEDEAKKICGV